MSLISKLARVLANHSRSNISNASFSARNACYSFLSFLARAQRSRNPFVRDPFALMASGRATERPFCHGWDRLRPDRNAILSFGSPREPTMYELFFSRVTGVVIRSGASCRRAVRVSHPLK